MVQEDASSVLRPVPRHLERGTDDEQVSAKQTHESVHQKHDNSVCVCVRVGSDLVALLSALENRLYPAAEGL